MEGRDKVPSVKCHVVSSHDTLGSIAAKYDITPSQLVSINRLSSRTVFSGQSLIVTPESNSEKKIMEDNDIFDTHFAQIDVRHMTKDGSGIVLGTLLFTTKTVIFNGNPCDPLVAESESDRFQIVTPTDLIVNYVIFKDYFKFREESYDIPDPTSLIFTNDETVEITGRETYYLRLTMGKSLDFSSLTSSPILSYGQEQNLQNEYWFLFQGHNRVVKLLNFLLDRYSNYYGPLNISDIHSRGYELIKSGDFVEEINKETSVVEELFIPKLIGGASEIFSEACIPRLSKSLPSRTDGHDWTLVFSTSIHGFSLKNLYRKMPEDSSEAILMVIQSTDDSVFGAYLSKIPRIVENFLGTGESFLFTIKPNFNVYPWSGENEYFVKGNPDSLIIGAGEGHFALWLDEDLNQGRSQPSSTFSSPQLSQNEDFIIKILECWSFIL